MRGPFRDPRTVTPRTGRRGRGTARVLLARDRVLGGFVADLDEAVTPAERQDGRGEVDAVQGEAPCNCSNGDSSPATPSIRSDSLTMRSKSSTSGMTSPSDEGGDRGKLVDVERAEDGL